jgi:hypothetical protein
MEVTASRFVLDSNGDVAATSDLQKRLLTKINPGKVP